MTDNTEELARAIIGRTFSETEKKELSDRARTQSRQMLNEFRAYSFTLEETSLLLSVSESYVIDLIEKRELLAWKDCWSGTDEWRFPKEQFLGDKVLPQVKRCLQALEDIEPTHLGVTSFLTRPELEFFGRCRLQVMHDNADWDRIFTVYCRSLGSD